MSGAALGRRSHVIHGADGGKIIMCVCGTETITRLFVGLVNWQKTYQEIDQSLATVSII